MALTQRHPAGSSSSGDLYNARRLYSPQVAITGDSHFDTLKTRAMIQVLAAIENAHGQFKDHSGQNYLLVALARIRRLGSLPSSPLIMEQTTRDRRLAAAAHPRANAPRFRPRDAPVPLMTTPRS